MSKKVYVAPEIGIIQISTGESIANLNLGSIQGDPGGLGGEGSEHPVDAKEFKFEPWDIWEEDPED